MKRIQIMVMGFVLLFAVSVMASEKVKKEAKDIPIEKWLKTGPILAHLPVFHETANVKGKKFELADLLAETHGDEKQWWPEKDDILQWNKSASFKWTHLTTDTSGFIHLTLTDTAKPEISFLVTYLEANRWMKSSMEITSPHLLQVYFDGQPVATKKTSDNKDKEAGNLTKELTLETGKHILLIKALKDPQAGRDWNLKACLKLSSEYDAASLTSTTSPEQTMTIEHLLDGPKVRNASISPNGELIALSLNKSLPPSDKSESWIELRTAKDGKLQHTYRGGMKLSRVSWAPVGKKFAYTTREKDGATLWIVDLDAGTSTPLLENQKEFGGFSWAPNGSFIIYSRTEKPEPDKTGLKKLRGMPDRWPGWRNRSFLYLINVPEGTQRKLTHGSLSTSLNSISHDSKKIIFSRSIEDYSKRPYSRTEFWVLNLTTMALDSLWSTYWGGSVQWSPDDRKLLVTGGPSAFGDIGKNVPEGVIPNDYDTQAYIFDFSSKSIEAITQNFKPSINSAFWSQTEQCIYFTTTDKSYQHLYRYDLKKKNFKRIDTGIEVLSNIDFAKNKAAAVYTGTSATVPPKAYFLNLKNNKYRLIADPGKTDFEHVNFADVQRWTFQNERGVEIEGRIYFPPHFDSAKKYPCIVYYYGGTSPVTRDFGGRYPKNLYAAQGYIVYVLQPSGATGFGQEFSAQHVNDWGIIVADEIIDGVKKFLHAHPFVDRDRLGCIGASYGGFMTMLLQTRTDIFATAIAHAGISSLSSYWGEGYWGYLYSAVATANSFPWNRKDIYVDQSALFNADNINTPLLLLHGAVDTNVPPGESIQLYTALKLLGKEVELIEVEGQNHHIMQYNKRIRWTKTIMAWFDKWLKDQPQWWNDMYPEN